MTKKDLLIQEAARYIARHKRLDLTEVKKALTPLRVTTNEGDQVHEIMDRAHPEPGEHDDIEREMVDYIHAKAELPGGSRDAVDEYLRDFPDHFRVIDKNEFPQFPPTHRHDTMEKFLEKRGTEEAEALKRDYEDGVFEISPSKPTYNFQNEIHSSGPFAVHKDSNNNDPSRYNVHIFNKENQTHVGSISVLRKDPSTHNQHNIAYQLKYNLKPIIDNPFNTGKNHRQVFDSISTAVHNHIMTQLYPKK